jgi:hypothetical protein
MAAELFHVDRWTDEQTDRHYEKKNHFSYFGERGYKLHKTHKYVHSLDKIQSHSMLNYMVYIPSTLNTRQNLRTYHSM